MRRFTLLLLFSLVLSSFVGAQRPRSAGPYRLWIQEAVLDGRELICVARIDRTRRLPNGETVDRLAVAKVLRGEGKKTVSVMAGTEVFRERGQGDQIVFLDRRSGGSLYRFVDAVAVEGKEGGRRIVALEQLLAASALPRERDRMTTTLFFLRVHAVSESSWVRRVVVREMDRLSRRAPDLFDIATIEALRGLTTADLPGAERRLFREASQRIQNRAGIDWTNSPRAFRDPARRESFLKELAAFRRGGEDQVRIDFLDRAARRFGALMAPVLVNGIEDRAPAIRRHSVFLLGELEAAGGTERLLSLARRSEDPLRDEALVALEKIAPLDGVPAILRLAQDRTVRTAAWRVLAAINSGEARLFLKDTQRALAADPEATDEDRKRIAEVLGKAFQKEVATARDARRRRWRPDTRD